jgi:hypothetical protein
VASSVPIADKVLGSLTLFMVDSWAAAAGQMERYAYVVSSKTTMIGIWKGGVEWRCLGT